MEKVTISKEVLRNLMLLSYEKAYFQGFQSHRDSTGYSTEGSTILVDELLEKYSSLISK